ncbi:MAG TPA: single-stranded DNA-binding protein [bacterium]|jgi:single-strand DNA-binding protein
MAELRMPDVNNIIIAGNLIKDPTFRHTTTGGIPVANFSIASNRRFKDNAGRWKEDVCIIGVVAWYKLAESCHLSLKKGSAVLVEGELQSRIIKIDDGYTRNIIEIKSRRIQFLNKKDGTVFVAEAQGGEEMVHEYGDAEPGTERRPSSLGDSESNNGLINLRL